VELSQFKKWDLMSWSLIFKVNTGEIFFFFFYLVYSLYFNWSLVPGACDEVLKVTHSSEGEERKEQSAAGKSREEQKHSITSAITNCWKSS